MVKQKSQLNAERHDRLREMGYQYADWFLRNKQWKSEANAVRALCRKQPKCSPEECESAFKVGMALYHASISFVEDNVQTLWERWRAIPESNDKCAAMMNVDDLIAPLRKQIPGFPDTTYESAIQGTFFFWNVL